MLKIDCPHCGIQLLIPDKYAGTVGRCKHCGKKLTVPTMEVATSKTEGSSIPDAADTRNEQKKSAELQDQFDDERKGNRQYPELKEGSLADGCTARIAPSTQASQPARLTEKFGLRQIIGIVGAIVLFIAVFTPIVSMPIMGNINYFQNGKGDGVIVLVLAVFSLVAVLIKKDVLLFFTSLGCLGTLTFTFVNFKIRNRSGLLMCFPSPETRISVVTT